MQQCRHCGREIRPDATGAPAWLDTTDTSYVCPGTGADYTGTWHEPFDGTEGQDRESYTDTQDRDSYTIGGEV